MLVPRLIALKDFKLLNGHLFTIVIKKENQYCYMMKLELDEKSIKNLVKYAKNHPKEILELMEQLADQAIDILMKQEIVDRGAQLYRRIKKQITSIEGVTIHKCPVCRHQPLEKVEGKLHCLECNWIEE